MPLKTGAHVGGILSVADVRERCYVNAETGCWEWRGSTGGTSGVPQAYLPVERRLTTIGSILFRLTTGERLPTGAKFYRTCECMRCANPAHRTLGTASDVMNQARYKHTAVSRARIAATKRKTAKVTPEQCAEIRLSPEPCRVLAKRYGIGPTMVLNIRNGKAHRPLDGMTACIFNLQS